MMLPQSEVEFSERVRLQLSRIEEKDLQGNEKRFGGQLLTFLIGSLLMLSNDRKDVRIGRGLRNGAIASFAELVGLKLGRWMRDSL